MIDLFKNYPKTDMFEIVNVISLDHQYVLTKRHLDYAEKASEGKLSCRTIIDVECKYGPSCGHPGCDLYYRQHKKALVVAVKFDGDVNEAPGLHKYLQDCNKQMIADGMDGFLFQQIKSTGM